MSGTGRRQQKYKDCWAEWCCPGRCGFFTPIAVGAILAFAILAFFFGLWAWNSSTFHQRQAQYVASGVLANSPWAAVLTGTTAQEMTLPNNLIEYIYVNYRVVCVSPLGHKIKITPGVLPTTWDGVNTVANCPMGVVNAGFDFHVISQSIIYVSNVQGGVTFTAS